MACKMSSFGHKREFYLRASESKAREIWHKATSRKVSANYISSYFSCIQTLKLFYKLLALHQSIHALLLTCPVTIFGCS